MAEFWTSLVRDIHEHPLAWACILAGAIAAIMLWGCICGLPLVHSAPFDVGAAQPRLA